MMSNSQSNICLSPQKKQHYVNMVTNRHHHLRTGRESRFYPPENRNPAVFAVVCSQSLFLSILLLHSLSCQPLFLGHFSISLDVTLTLHDLLSKVPEDHPLQLAHLALNRTATCIDSFTLPHLRSLISSV